MPNLPPMVVWLLVDLSHQSDSGDLVISKQNLCWAARTILNEGIGSPYRSVKQAAIDQYLESDEAKLFVANDAGADGRDPPIHFLLDIVAVILGKYGMDFSVEAWQSLVSSIARVKESENNKAPGVPCSGGRFGMGLHRRSDDGATSSDSTPSSVRAGLTSTDSVATFLTGCHAAPAPWFDNLTPDQILAKLHERDKKIEDLESTYETQESSEIMAQNGTQAITNRRLNLLRARLRSKKKECQKLVKANKKLESHKAKLEGKVKTLSSMLIERNGKYAKKQDNEDETGIPDRGWLTPPGIIQLAIKRNLAHCASEHLQLLIQQDVSRWTVSSALEHCFRFVFGGG